MKKILLLVVFTLISLQGRAFQVTAEDISYPFDSITIVSAFKFDVQITSSLGPDSLLYELVELNDILTIYVAELSFVSDGVVVSGSPNVLIVTDSDGVDLFRFLVNSYTFYPDTSRTWGFASHILIDPLVGVFKDMDILSQGLKELVVFENIATNSWSFRDNLGLEMNALPDTYAEEIDLSIQISAYVEAE